MLIPDTKEKIIERIKSFHPNHPLTMSILTHYLNDVWETYSNDKVAVEADILHDMLIPRSSVILAYPRWVDRNGVRHTAFSLSSVWNDTHVVHGGTRMSKTLGVDPVDEVKFLSVSQEIKDRATGLPMDGGKLLVVVDPKKRTSAEIRSILRAHVFEMHKNNVWGEDKRVTAGDLNVGSVEVGDMYGMFRDLGYPSNIISGKPVELGGLQFREVATGYGLMFFTLEVVKALGGQSLGGKKIVMSGAGNVSLGAAKAITEFLGGTLLTLSDTSGYVYKATGFTSEDITLTKECKNEHRKGGKRFGFKDFYKELKDAKFMANESVWTINSELDIALPCAFQNEINGINMKQLIKQGCYIVGEGSNKGLTDDAIDICDKAPITYAKGTVANSGGVITSFLERKSKYISTFFDIDYQDVLQKQMQQIHEGVMGCGGLPKNERTPQRVCNIPKGANILGYINWKDARLAIQK